MAGVLVDLIRSALQGNHQAPWFGPSPRISNRDFVLQAFRTGACEALHHMKLFARSGHEAGGFVVGGIDDQRVALPMAARIPQPELDRGWQMRTSIEWNDADVVNHFGLEGHCVRRLNNPRIALITRGQLRRAVRYTTFLQGSILGAFGPASPRRCNGGSSLLSLGCDRGNPPIRRVGNERGAIFPFSLDGPYRAIIACFAIDALET